MPATFTSPFDLSQVLDLFQTTFLVRHFMDVGPTSKLIDGKILQADAETAGRWPVDARAPMITAVKLLETIPVLRVMHEGQLVGWVHGGCLNAPAFRMWLFGVLGILDQHEAIVLQEIYPGDSWTEYLSPGRLRAARELQEERRRRGQECTLFACLQLADKTQLLVESPIGAKLGYTSRRIRSEAVKALAMLRNQLAHHQDIFPDCARTVFGIANRADELLGGARLREALTPAATAS